MHSFTDCSHKNQYRTETEAERVADHQMSLRPGLQLRVYRCDSCQSYHLTSKPRRY